MTGTKLVMGASGFLGSHVTRKLVERGDEVRVWIRESSSTVGFDDLEVERTYGELGDRDALRAAMAGVETVFYCIVDTRAWLRDPTPLFATNVEALRGVLDVAVEVGVPRFVFCSTVGTIGIAGSGLADEELPHNWRHLGGPYIESRLQAEELVLAYQRDHGLPAVVLNVGTTYGPRDHVPTPHGKLVRAAARGKMPAYVRGASMEVVGVEDAATAFLLAEEKGRIGERYIVSESYLPIRDLFTVAADEGGSQTAPRRHPAAGDEGDRRSRRRRLAPPWHRFGRHVDQRATDAHPVGARSLQGHPRARLGAGAGGGRNPRGGALVRQSALR